MKGVNPYEVFHNADMKGFNDGVGYSYFNGNTYIFDLDDDDIPRPVKMRRGYNKIIVDIIESDEFQNNRPKAIRGVLEKYRNVKGNNNNSLFSVRQSDVVVRGVAMDSKRISNEHSNNNSEDSVYNRSKTELKEVGFSATRCGAEGRGCSAWYRGCRCGA